LLGLGVLLDFFFPVVAALPMADLPLNGLTLGGNRTMVNQR